MNVVKISSSLKRSVAETAKRLKSLAHLAPSNIPTRRLGTKVHTTQKGHSGYKCRSKLQTPGEGTGIFDSQVSAKAEEDSKGRPQLPTHDQATTNHCGSVLSAEDGDCGSLQAHSNSKEQTSDEQLGPILGETGADGRQDTEEGRDEDCTTSAQNSIHGVREPASKSGTCNVRSGVYDTDQPLVSHTCRLGNTKGIRERQVSTV